MSDFALQRLGVGAREARSTVDRLRGGKPAIEAVEQDISSDKGKHIK
jgi:hypothetical protein